VPKSRRKKRPSSAPGPLRGAGPIEYELDLHGERVLDAMPRIEQHIRRNHAAAQPWVHIVHGRGTGALRSAVQDFLKKHKLVGRYYFAPPTTGGDGVTIAELEYGQSRSTRREIDGRGGPVDTNE